MFKNDLRFAPTRYLNAPGIEMHKVENFLHVIFIEISRWTGRRSLWNFIFIIFNFYYSASVSDTLTILYERVLAYKKLKFWTNSVKTDRT